MRKDKADPEFSRFLRQVRREEHVLQQQLSEGLMTNSQLARIEKGQRSVSKNMRDRLLGRLGISCDLYENLLNIEDYAAWELQRDILSAVEQREGQRAQELIAEYEQQEPEAFRDKIKQQFCLVMRAEILRQQGAEQRGIGACYEKAVKLTVPDADCFCVAQKLLSIQEINMVLEYEFYHQKSDFLERCKELMTFVENSAYDDLSKVKIYPKIAYYYLQEAVLGQSKQGADRLSEWLDICSRAIEMLRDTGRAYYLLELLEMKTKIVESREEEQTQETLQECKELADLLKSLYAEYEVPAYMQDCTYLYQQRWVFYIGDVLRVRRKMYGLTQGELCGHDCSARTLRRTEKREANMQHEALGVLLSKLGLSKEFQKVRFASNDREGLNLMGAIAVCRNNREPERAKAILEQMKDKSSVKIPENRQYFMEVEAALDWMMGKITKEEFAKREEEALRCTLKVKDLYRMDEVYLTEMEMVCISKRIQALPDTEKRKWIDFLLHFFEGYEKKNTLSDCITVYEFAIMRVIYELGNLKEHQRSAALAKKILREDLKCRRVWGIDEYLYEISWNRNEKMTESLRQCIILSHFCKRLFYENFYLKKIYQS